MRILYHFDRIALEWISESDPLQQPQHETAHDKSFPTYQKKQAPNAPEPHPETLQMNPYEYEDDYFPALPDDLTEKEIEELESLAELADQEASVPTAQERNPNLK